MSFQYPTSGRTAWSDYAPIREGQVIASFSTLPRVELPGAMFLLVEVALPLSFQYPTSGRTAWSRPRSRRRRAGPDPFSTLPRVELPGAAGTRREGGGGRCPFSTLPRVELPGAAVRLPQCGCCRLFQYPTSGRTAWSLDGPEGQEAIDLHFQYPTSGRTAWSRLTVIPAIHPISLFQYPTSGRTAWSHPQQPAPRGLPGSFSTLPRVELPGALSGV